MEAPNKKIDQKSEVEERNHTDKRAREEPEQELLEAPYGEAGV